MPNRRIKARWHEDQRQHESGRHTAVERVLDRGGLRWLHARTDRTERQPIYIELPHERARGAARHAAVRTRTRAIHIGVMPPHITTAESTSIAVGRLGRS